MRLDVPDTAEEERDQVDESGDPIRDWEFSANQGALVARQTHSLFLPGKSSSSGTALLWGHPGAVSVILETFPGTPIALGEFPLAIFSLFLYF
jgi:hypothetical protein